MLRYRTPLSLTCWLIAGFASTALSDPYPCNHEKATIHGVIRDIDGAPVSQATVAFTGMVWDSTCRHGTSTRIKAITDDKGTYVLTVPSGVGSLHVDQSRRHEVLRWEELFAGDVVIDHRFVQYHVRGRVVAADSVQGEAMITYYRDPGRGVGMCGTGLPEVQTAGRTFDITVDRAGRYIVAAWIPGGGGAWSMKPAGGYAATSLFIRSDTTLTLNLGGDPVRGRVRGYAGLPQKLASVFAYGPNGSSRAFCDSVGQFQMQLPAGSYWWSVEPRERDVERWASREAVDFRPGNVVDLDLDVVEWIGTARYEGSAETVPDVLICVEEEGREGQGSPARCVTDRYGDFHLTVRRGVSHRLSVQEATSPWRPQRVRALTVGGASSSTDSSFDIVLERLWVPEPRHTICPPKEKSTIAVHRTEESHK